MSKILSSITIFTLIITLCGFNPKIAKAATNPPMPESCGIDMVLVIDTSASITSADRVKMKAAFNSFVDAVLPATPAKIAVVSFNTTATVNLSFNTNSTTIKSAINAISGSGYTNWEAAISLAQSQFPSDKKPHLIVFTSDGNPTASSKGPNNLNQPNIHLEPAKTQANIAWTAGTRIITLGVGKDVNANNLIAISSADASYTTASFATLSTTLQDLVTKLCGGKIITTKIIDADGDLTTTNDQTPGQGWNFNIAGVVTVTDALGKTQAVSITDKNGPFSVLQISQPGYVPLYVSCVNVTNNNEPVGVSTVMDIVNGINMTTDDIISCIFYSKPGPAPTGTLSAKDCTIAINSSSCDATLNWETKNPIVTSAVTTPTNITVATGNIGTKSYPVGYGSRTFYLYDNSALLAQATANATCGDPTKAYWDGVANKCVGVLTGTLEVASGLGGPSCYIAKGQKTCKTTLNITINNPVPGAVTNITKPNNIVVATFAPGVTSGTKAGIDVSYSGTTFYLYQNAKNLDSITVNATCNPAENTHWGGDNVGCVEPLVDGYWKETCGECNQSSCRQQCSRVCIPPKGGGADCPPTNFNSNPRCYVGACGGNGLLNIKFNAAPAKIFKGKSTMLTWSSSGDSCLGTTNNAGVFDTGNKANGSATVKPLTTTIYKVTCTDKTDGTTESKEFTVKVDTITIIEK